MGWGWRNRVIFKKDIHKERKKSHCVWLDAVRGTEAQRDYVLGAKEHFSMLFRLEDAIEREWVKIQGRSRVLHWFPAHTTSKWVGELPKPPSSPTPGQTPVFTPPKKKTCPPFSGRSKQGKSLLVLAPLCCSRCPSKTLPEKKIHGERRQNTERPRIWQDKAKTAWRQVERDYKETRLSFRTLKLSVYVDIDLFIDGREEHRKEHFMVSIFLLSFYGE